MSFDFAEIYRATRLGLLTLAADLSDAEWMTLAPATPEWTVKDLYGHLTGVAADLLTDNLEIVGSDEWTALQVAARADHSPQEVCAEWKAVGPEVEGRLAAIGSPLSSMVIDVWHHEQDVRNAVDRTANRSGEGLRLSLSLNPRFVHAARVRVWSRAVVYWWAQGQLVGRWMVGVLAPVVRRPGMVR